MKKEDEKTGKTKATETPKKTDKKKELARERRRQPALERLGTNNPRCVFCGEDDPHVLEKHHIAGKAYDDFTSIHCRNCHRKQSNRQKDHPNQTGVPVELSEIIGRFLLGLADFFELLIEKLREFGNLLIQGVQANTATAEVRT